MVLVVLAVLLLPGLAAALVTRPFVPRPSLAPVRALLTGLAVAAGGMLLISLTRTWWVVEDSERDTTIVTRGDSGLVLVIVTVGLLCSVVTVAGVWGRRNWAPLVLTVQWLLIAIAWYTSTGELTDSDAAGTAEGGLELATWSVLLATITATLGSLGRLAERRGRGHGRGHGRQSADPSGSKLSGWDLGMAMLMAALVIAGFLGLLPYGLGAPLALVSLLVAGIRLRALTASRSL